MKRSIGVIIFFAGLTCLFTFPVIIRAGTGVYGLNQFRGDPLGTIWWIWWYGYAWHSGVSAGFVPLLNYPFGINWAARPIAPLLDYPVAGLNFLFGNEILTYNLVILAGLVLTAFFMFLLVRYLTRSNIAGVIAGVIFGFCPNQLMQSAQHLGFSMVFWIPLFALCLFRLKDNVSFINAVLCALTGAVVVLSNYYYGYFMAVFTLIFLLWWILAGGMRLREAGFAVLAGVLGLVFVSPFILPVLLRQAAGAGVVQPAGDLVKYAARWYDYFLPSEFHPVFGRWTQGYARHYFERSLYIGCVPIILAVVAVVRSLRHKAQDASRFVIFFFAAAGVIFFVVSLKPVFQIGGLKIPNFSWFAYKILPMFRVYARMGVLVIFSVAVLAGYGLKYVLDAIKSRRGKVAVFILCIGLVLFEYINFPPFHNVDLSGVPSIYKWLGEEPEGVVAAEYPLVRSVEERHSEYLFHQRVHKKPLINGASEGTLGDAFRREMRYPHFVETAGLLAYLGADYLIVHKDCYTEQYLREIDGNRGLEFIADFPAARVYRIVAEPEELVTVFWKDFGSWERWDDGRDWRWMGNNATVWLGNGPIETKDPERQASGAGEGRRMRDEKKVDIRFRILAFAKARELKVYVNDALVKKLDAPVPSNSELAKRVVLENILLRPGGNIIRFYTSQGEDRIGDILHNNDDRRVSFAVSGFNVIEGQ